MSDESPTIGAAQVDALLAFLPAFDQPGAQLGEWHAPPGAFPFWDAGPAAQQFLETLYAQQIIGLAWRLEQDAVDRYVAGGAAALADADATTLCALLATHARADRFVEGHLAAMFSQGHITAILRRLAQIRPAMGEG